MQISQRLGLFGGKLSTRVGSDDVLTIAHEKLFNKNETRYLLDHIDPRYDTLRRFSVASAVTSLISILLSAALLWYGKTYLVPPDDGVVLFFSGLLFITALIAGLKALRSRMNLVLFNSHDGRRLFTLYGNKPNAQEVTEFCLQLAKRIERIRYSGELSTERMSSILTKHADYLAEQGVLSEAEHKAVLSRIAKKGKPSVVSIFG